MKSVIGFQGRLFNLARKTLKRHGSNRAAVAVSAPVHGAAIARSTLRAAFRCGVAQVREPDPGALPVVPRRVGKAPARGERGVTSPGCTRSRPIVVPVPLQTSLILASNSNSNKVGELLSQCARHSSSTAPSGTMPAGVTVTGKPNTHGRRRTTLVSTHLSPLLFCIRPLDS